MNQSTHAALLPSATAPAEAPAILPAAGLTAALASANATLLVHVPDTDGFCSGCLDLYARLSWTPCPQAAWAFELIWACSAPVHPDEPAADAAPLSMAMDKR